MFDVGFSELVLIALLALIVLGPKRLPEVARAAGKWLGRLRRFVEDVKQDFDRELNSAELAELKKLKQELNDTRRVMEESTGEIYRHVADAGSLPPPTDSVSDQTSSPPPGVTAEPKAPSSARRSPNKRTANNHGATKKARKR